MVTRIERHDIIVQLEGQEINRLYGVDETYRVEAARYDLQAAILSVVFTKDREVVDGEDQATSSE